MCSGSLDHHSFGSLESTLFDHLTTFKRKEPGIGPDFIHFRTGFGLQIEHSANNGTTRGWVQPVEKSHRTLIDRRRRRGGGWFFLQRGAGESGGHIM